MDNGKRKIGPYKGYYGSIEFSQADFCFFGQILDIEDVVTYEADDKDWLETEFKMAVDDYIETREVLDVE